MPSWKGMTKKQRSEEMKRRLMIARANKIKILPQLRQELASNEAEEVNHKKALNQSYWEGYAEARRKYEERIDMLFDYIKGLRN